MRVSFFSLNLSPLPSALYHQEVPSLSSVQAVDLSCKKSPPSPTSTPSPVPSTQTGPLLLSLPSSTEPGSVLCHPHKDPNTSAVMAALPCPPTAVQVIVLK